MYEDKIGCKLELHNTNLTGLIDGGTVTSISGCQVYYENGTYKGTFHIDHIANGNVSCLGTTLKKITHIVIWEENSDPVKYFGDKESAEDWIRGLAKRSAVKEGSIVLIDLPNKIVKQVTIHKQIKLKEKNVH